MKTRTAGKRRPQSLTSRGGPDRIRSAGHVQPILPFRPCSPPPAVLLLLLLRRVPLPSRHLRGGAPGRVDGEDRPSPLLGIQHPLAQVFAREVEEAGVAGSGLGGVDLPAQVSDHGIEAAFLVRQAAGFLGESRGRGRRGRRGVAGSGDVEAVHPGDDVLGPLGETKR